MTTQEQDMTAYDEDTDPRETRSHADNGKTVLPSPEGWLLQVSLKTPAGTLINIRGMNQWDLAIGLEGISGLAHQIKETEDKFGGPPPALVQQLGARQAPPAVQQQANPGQQQAGPNCQCGYPARLVPGGISKKTGNPYRAFYACGNPVRDAECRFRANA